MKHIYNAEEYNFLNTIKKEILETKTLECLDTLKPSERAIQNILSFSKAYESKPSKYVGRHTTILN